QTAVPARAAGLRGRRHHQRRLTRARRADLGQLHPRGVGTALLIPPVYILTTMLFTDIPSRARAFGAISGFGGIGAATGPLIGGMITTAISWRASFVFQALIIVVILVLGRGIVDPVPADPTRPFATAGAVLS